MLTMSPPARATSARSERLSRARCVAEVTDALLEQTTAVVEGHAALVALRPVGGGQSGPLPWHSALRGPDGVPPAFPPLPADAAVRLSISGVVGAEACVAGDPLLALAPVFEGTGAARFAFVGLGRFGTLFLAERRPDREFDPDDWHLLGVVARQAEAALERIAVADGTA